MIRSLMARTTRAASGSARQSQRISTSTNTKKQSSKIKKEEETESLVKEEPTSPETKSAKKQTSKKRAAPSDPKADTDVKKRKKSKAVETTGLPSPSNSSETKESPLIESATDSPSKVKTKSKKSNPEDLKSKKLKSYSQYANQSPFPDFGHPTGPEVKLAHKILKSLHGERKRPKEVIASTTRAGCGDSPSVLDALVRTILSQNTSDANSTRAKLSMDKQYGGSDKWDAIVEGGQSKLQEAIKSGGLSVVKSKVIISILEQAKQKYGKYSLDHLHEASSEDAMTEMLSFQGVGPKTASCVLLFCLQRESFAVDTHVHRITGLLNWRPKNATRDQTYSHLDVMIPDEDKYGLHILLVSHGKRCEECKAGGKNLGKCELRKAFRKGKLEGEAGEEVKKEEENVKVEASDE